MAWIDKKNAFDYVLPHLFQYRHYKLPLTRLELYNGDIFSQTMLVNIKLQTKVYNALCLFSILHI